MLIRKLLRKNLKLECVLTKEQENKFNALETRVGSMEKGIDDIKTMLSKVLTNK